MYSRLCRSLSKLYRPLSTSPTGSENTDHASIAAQVRSHEQNTHEGCIVEDRPIDGDRPVRVVIMGAGISGITACIRFAQRIRNVDLCVYEKNADVGGTWYENRYPGCACDIPAHTYQVTFEPNVEWSRFYASGKEIYQYWKRVARKYGCMKYIKLRQRVVEARWNELQGKWQLQVENGDDGSVYSDSCDVLISSQGSLNNWKWPNIPGLHDFKGKLLHTANWDETYDYKGKRIAVIGNGSSGIQVVPAMLPDVVHIDHYARSRTWLAPTLAREKIDEREGTGKDNITFTPEEIARFKADPSLYQRFRKEVELDLQSNFGVTIKGTPEQLSGPEFFTLDMRRRLDRKPELLDHIVPPFPPGCRRLTPGPGYLEALTDEKVDLIKTEISKIDAEGITTTDGQHRPVDAIVCATGFDTTYCPRFPIIGRNGLSLGDKWRERPDSYISLATDQFPNYFICLGPNAVLGHGNLLLLIEKAIDYMTQCVAKMQRDNIRWMVPRRAVVDRFRKHCDQYFTRTVFSDKCRSWYKSGREDGPVTAVWPGSSLHATKAFANPRWEDFEYGYMNDNPNGWFGDGWTADEKNKTVNVNYLDDDQVDYPTPVTLDDDIDIGLPIINAHHNGKFAALNGRQVVTVAVAVDGDGLNLST